uniref:Uncharacterized protein n=1 Tax=viral metagenome TaxID=1070528 RepID=A0A6M3K379_9ZZZZ
MAKDKGTDKIIRQLKNEYYKNWRKKNPDKVKKAQERYWNKKALEVLSSKEN